ncbi:MAG TPA: FAD-binding oxidoreductase [Candidatus Nitrosotalea sp.]|jgi:FAD/FMN-containing dehydrogenase|nr:FAD-binding oxidoreductase [Candidatus Nitrosotalea sp.]
MARLIPAASAALEPVAGWGRHPIVPGRVERPEHLALRAGVEPLVPRGLGRAYGDAAVPAAPGGHVLETTRADRIRDFDPVTGRLRCEAGLSLAEILRVFVPRGWFPPVTPGTKFVTVGACVACDVHGKNHHRDGSFGSFVDRIVLLTADGRLVECGPDRERELFLATVGGMGLTGLIVEVTLRLRRVETPWIVLETQGMGSLESMLEGLRLSAAHWPYTVGWIDCLAQGRDVGRGILMRGRHATQVEAGTRRVRRAPRLRVPFDAPEWLLNPLFMRWFNRLYAWSHGRTLRRRIVSYDAFFYPLDAVSQWNRLYGRRGFLQYQCVVPHAAGPAPVTALLERLAAAGAASFLAVIKDCGPASDAYLSFPLEGITLALDLPYRGAVTEALLHDMNAIVIDHGGRVYLAKDAVTRAGDFARMMPRLPEWRAVRDRWDPGRRFRSALSVRLFGDPV